MHREPHEKNRAVVLVGHGSSKTAESAAPVYRHARRLAQSGDFASVRVAFWKEEPYLHTASSGLRLPTAIVPMFMAEGYFAGGVVPRELELDQRDHLSYADALGTHPGLVDLARTELQTWTRPDVDLIVVGHGTPRDPDSRTTAQQATEALRESGDFRSAVCAFIDDEPRVPDAVSALPEDATVVVLPFFVADGPHTRVDLAQALGLQPYTEFGAHDAGKRTIVLLGALGESEGIGSLVTDLAERAFESARGSSEAHQATAEQFAASIEADGRIGEVAIVPNNGGWLLHRVGDAPANCRPLASVFDLHDVARTTPDRTHRPLRSMGQLPAGWQFHADTPTELVEAVEAIYPGTVDTQLDPERIARTLPWVLRRQTGRYAKLDQLHRQTIDEAVEAVCERKCQRDRVWDGRLGNGDGPPCPRACNFLLDSMC